MLARALTRGFFSLLHPRMLWLMLWPIIVALAIWTVFAALYWGQVAAWITLQLQQSAAFQWATSAWPFTLIVAWLGWLLLLLLFVPVVLITAVIIIGIFSMPAMVEHVGTREYPALARMKGGTFAGSVWNAVAGLALFVLLGVVTLPLWLLPFLWPFIPLALLGYLNQRVFRYDALAEHGSPTEISEVIRRWRGEMFLLGVVLALIGHVPVLGLLMPLYAGLAFIHYCLGRVAQLREENRSTAVV